MSKGQDQNKDNNGPLLLTYQGDGKYSLAGQGQKLFYEHHGYCSKNVWAITRSSFNICNYIDFTLDDCMRMPTNNHIWIKQLNVEINDLNTKKNQFYINGIQQFVTGCGFHTQQTLGSSNEAVKVTYEHEDKIEDFDGISFSAFDTCPFETFDKILSMRTTKFIDPTTTNNDYKLVVRTQIEEGVYDYQPIQMITDDLPKDESKVVYLYSICQVLQGTKDINGQKVVFNKNANNMSIKEKCAYYEKLEKNGFEATLLNYDTTKKYDNSCFVCVSGDIIEKCFEDENKTYDGWKIVDIQQNSVHIENVNCPEFNFDAIMLNGTLDATMIC